MRYFWQPSKTVRALGLVPEALGADYAQAKARALELNAIADEMRRTVRNGSNGPRPGTCARLFQEFMDSDEFNNEKKERTRKDYRYYLGKIEADFGDVMVRALTPKIIKTYYRRLCHEVSLTWASHILAHWRGVLSWAVSEDWIPKNPALDVKLKAPKARDVMWTIAQRDTYVAKALEMDKESISVMLLVADSIAQSPVDVRTLRRKTYDGCTIDVARQKTGVKDAPIVLFPEAKAALDTYLAKQPPKLPDAPLFTHDRIGGMWKPSTLAKWHGKIRAAAGLPRELQLQDLRTTGQTEAGAAGGTVDEIRALARHKTRSAGLRYVHPDSRFVDAVQAKRLAHRTEARNEQGENVGIPLEKKLES
ncbi:MAG: hypothetical protein KGR48_04555 [Alphaproteobacteria bacterium]|nr:hypothetical protein [Alphaproteobacteria bacterium]